jgi:hypothetical protein
MIALYVSCGVGAALFLLLFLLGSSGVEPEAENSGTGARETPCRGDVVRHVFSRYDLDFVESERSARLRKMFVEERRKIAKAWIRRTAHELRVAMRMHIHEARGRRDLEAAAEVRIFAQYIWLRCLCGLLLVSTIVLQPSLLQEIAMHASNLSRRLGAMGGAAQLVPREVHGFRPNA